MSNEREVPAVQMEAPQGAAELQTAGRRSVDATPHQTATALFVSAFFDELMRLGVRDVVVSPGSRSTALSMVAFEASKRFPSKLNLYLDVDERGAAFFALGLAKATGRAVCVICTSGTALANYYPAVMEAECSRVPLMVLSGDRPARLQQLGAPQTCDQTKAFSTHVRKFVGMPEPSATPGAIAYVRQMARELVIAAAPGTHTSAPVHANFPFDEPLKPNLAAAGLFEVGRAVGGDDSAPLPGLVQSDSMLLPQVANQLAEFLQRYRTIVVCGEGTLSQEAIHDGNRRCREAQALFAFAAAFDAPLLADPLSQLRGVDSPSVIATYDNIFATDEVPAFDTVVRFGRYPVSKKLTTYLAQHKHTQIVVDLQDTRDFNSATTTFVQADPLDFVVALLETQNGVGQHISVPSFGAASAEEPERVPALDAFASAGGNLAAWAAAEQAQRTRIEEVRATGGNSFEGSYVRALLDIMPAHSLLFSANSMAVRAVDTFYTHAARGITVLANRGLNGIDGTTSTAFGAAQYFDQTVYLTGDLTFLHDINALALAQEFRRRAALGAPEPSIVVVVMNNAGGAIFDMLPQASDEDYFERLFLTPHETDFQSVVQGFKVGYSCVTTVNDFESIVRAKLGKPGVHVVEVPLPLRGVRSRYAAYQ